MLFNNSCQVVFVNVLDAIHITEEVIRQDDVDVITSDVRVLLEHFEEPAEVRESGRAGLGKIR